MTPDRDHPDLVPILRDIARPALSWAVHFVFVYAALSAVCADRALVGFEAGRIAVAVATAIAVVVAGWGLFRTGSDDLRRSARWSAIVSVIAILFSAAPLVLLNGCG